MHCWIVWNKIKNEQYPPPLPFFPFSYTVKWTIHGSGPLPLSLNKITQPLFSGPVSKNYDGNYVDSKFSKGKHSKRKKTQFRQDDAKKKQVKGTSCRLPHICKYMRHVYMSSLDILNQRPVNRDNWCTKTRYFGCFGSSWLFPQHFHAYFTLQHRTVASDGIFWMFLL